MTELVKTVEDLKKHVAIDFIDGFDVVEFAIEDRETELRTKYLGDTLWDKLKAEYAGGVVYNPETDGPLYAKALWYAQRIIINFALLDYVPEGSLDISENGIRITVNDTKKQAFPWQIKNLEDKYEKTANRNIENLLTFLDDNITRFDAWTASPVYTALKEHFVHSATEFQKYLNLDTSHVVFLKCLPDMGYVEDIMMRGMLGNDFYEELKERIKDAEDVDEPPADPTTSQDDEYDIVFDLIKGAIANYTGKRAAKILGCDPELCDETASHYVQRLVEYLNRNATDSLFANYFNSDKYTPPVDDETPFTSGGGIDNSEFTGVYEAF